MKRLQHALEHSKKQELVKGAICSLRDKRLVNGDDYVYIIKCCLFVKIGIAHDVKFRMSQMQVGCPFKLSLLASWKSDDALIEEEILHDRYDKHRVRGEWFNIPDAELIVLLSEVAG